MRHIDQLLLEHNFFTGISPEMSRSISACARQIRFERGVYLFRRGDTADTFYALRRGLVGLEWKSQVGSVLLQTHHPGDVLNINSLTPPYRCHSDARAIMPCIVIAINAQSLRRSCDTDHHLGYELMKRLAPTLALQLTEARLQALDIYGSANVS